MPARKKLIETIDARRAQWRTEAVARPSVLARRVGAVVPVGVEKVQVSLETFGIKNPLSFDANACGPAILALVPGWDNAAVQSFVTEREHQPFASYSDLVARLRKHSVPVAALQSMAD